MTEHEHTNTTRDGRVFAALWLVFFALIAALAWWAPAALVGAAWFTGIAAAVSLAFNADLPRTRQLAALVFPVGLVAVWGVERVSPAGAAGALLAVGVLGTGAMLVSPGLARRVRAFWIDAGAPIGWTVSAVLLGLVYFLIITPIGLIVRLTMGDPMRRRFEPGESDWIRREPATDRRRDYRQF
jgi:hypothetical protein